MPYSDELAFEKDLVKYLYTNCGWEKEVIKYPTEEDLIKNWANILFENNRQTDVLNNCPLTQGEMEQILNQVKDAKTPYKLNTFINGKTVSITRDNPDDSLHFGQPVSLKIYDRMEIAGGNSRYQIVEQPQFKTTNPVYPERRGDIMLLINGMPVYHIELKKSDVPITHAETQIEKYMVNRAFSGIFSLVQIFVAMNPEEAVYFANPGPDGKFNPLYFFHWCDSNNKPINDWDKFAHSLLMIPRAHEMIGFYTVSDASDGILKVLRPYQVYAAFGISNIVSKSHWTKEEQKAGYVWHTTGSGKTLTSFKTAQLISNMSNADKVVFLIDRIELGEQSFLDYQNFSSVDESIQDTDNTDALIRKLKSPEGDQRLIVTSIQKMSRIKDGDVPHTDLQKIRNKKIVFIVDECHRDQNGDMHQVIEHTFPSAMFFGFTGTPDHEETKNIFGSEIHRYTIANGINDKNVLGFDPYQVSTFDDHILREKVGLNQVHASSVQEALDDEDKRDRFLYFMGHGSSPCSMEEIESYIPKSQYETEKHQKAIVKDIINKWLIRSNNSKFHAIFATSSIPEAIQYYKLFKEENHSLNITAVFDPSDDNGHTSIAKMQGITEILLDYETKFGNFYNIAHYQDFKKDVCLRLAHKDPYRNLNREQQIDIVIVVDQLLTGFDSKWINTIYLDKILRSKNFIQAISRTNRLFGPDKKHGTIIWYRYPYTMKSYLDAAISEYSGNVPFGIFVPKLEENLNQLNLLYSEIIDIFNSVGIHNFERNHDDLAWKKKFAKVFSMFNDILDSAKIQGFFWGTEDYRFTHSDGTESMVRVNIDKDTYLILVQRYKELFPKGPSEGPEPPYDIDSHITEIKTDSINDDYMNSKFKQFIKDLNSGDPVAKENALNELHKSFAYLSQEDQTFARQFLYDVENGLEVEPDKTFKDYITEYKVRAHNTEVHKIAEGLGIDENKLNELMNLHPTANSINEYGRYDDLMADLDIDKARVFLEKRFNKTFSKAREVRIAADNLLRTIIIEGL